MDHHEIKHLYWRAGFGIQPQALHKLSSLDRLDVVDQLFRESQSVSELQIDTSELTNSLKQADLKNRKVIAALIRKSAEKVRELNIAWMKRLADPKELLRERMTLFWANHFVCHDKNILHIQRYNNTLRKHALGNFRDFSIAISKEASMIKYLNTKQNRKRQPNENFARELMELFMLGRDQYTEKDIKEAARAFTGWNHTIYGDFIFRKFQHDEGVKTFFNKQGNFNGEDIIDIILEQKQCARFICKKVYRYFVNDNINNDHLESMIAVFYTDYNIENLMQFVFNADWFYAEENIGAKIKSPVDLLVGIHQTVPVQFENERTLLYLQKLMGQVLLFPPNVAGWEGGRSWINANTTMLRLKLPSVLLTNGEIALDEKGEFEDNFKQFNRKANQKRQLKTTADWTAFNTRFSDLDTNDLPSILIQPTINIGTKKYLDQLEKEQLQSYCIQLMSIPEYQLC